MTLPNQQYPPGSINSGTGISAHAAKTQAQWKTETTAPMKNSFENNFFGSWIANLFGGFLGGIAGLISALFSGIFGGGSGGGLLDLVGGFAGQEQKITEAAGSIEGLEARVTALEGGGTRAVYSSNFVWENPGTGKIFVAVVSGGNAGSNAGTGTTAPQAGLDGGYVAREFLCENLPSTVNGIVGAGGATASQPGGRSTFHTLESIPGATGSVLTSQGAVTSASSPGRGGNGGTVGSSENPKINPQAGRSSPLAAGGYAGSSDNGYNGGPGEAVPLESDIPCGGGGGGGGEARNGAFVNPGDGGPGGAPGGGGGAGGRPGGFNGAAQGNGGPGANGRIIIIYTPGVGAA